jgi:signal transduction histidine kinase
VLLSVGTAVSVILLVGVVLYLVLSVKAINLTRRQSNFIDSVTHELKSPIASMKLYLQTLNRREVSHEQQASFYRFMLEDIERLDRLINQMLDAARLDSERVNEEAEDVALEPLLRNCADSVCLSYRVPQSTIRWDVEPCTVRASRVELELIFRNLLDNAVKYAAAEPIVEVSLKPGGDGQVIAQIADNGNGIPPKLRRKIFGRFVRLGMELEREKPGTGLGLYIVRTLVHRLRGRIRVRGRVESSGTVFEVQLPTKS